MSCRKPSLKGMKHTGHLGHFAKDKHIQRGHNDSGKPELETYSAIDTDPGEQPKWYAQYKGEESGQPGKVQRFEGEWEKIPGGYKLNKKKIRYEER